MRKWRDASAAAFLALSMLVMGAFTGCGGDNNSPSFLPQNGGISSTSSSTSSSSSSSSSTSSSGGLKVTASLFAVDADNQTLIAGSAGSSSQFTFTGSVNLPAPNGDTLDNSEIALTPDNEFMYVVNRAADDSVHPNKGIVSAYATNVGTGDAPELIGTFHVSHDIDPTAAVVNPEGDWLFVATGSDIDAFPINGDGTLGTPQSLGVNFNGNGKEVVALAVIEPSVENDDDIVVAILDRSNGTNVASFLFDETTGTKAGVTFIRSQADGDTPTSLSLVNLSGAGNTLYVGDSGGDVHVYAVNDDGSLNAPTEFVVTDPDEGDGVAQIVADEDNQILYVLSNGVLDQLGAFDINDDGSVGTLLNGGTLGADGGFVTVGDGVTQNGLSLVKDPNDQFVIAGVTNGAFNLWLIDIASAGADGDVTVNAATTFDAGGVVGPTSLTIANP